MLSAPPTLVTGVGELVAEMRAPDTGKRREEEAGSKQEEQEEEEKEEEKEEEEEEGALEQLPLAGPKALSANRISG